MSHPDKLAGTRSFPPLCLKHGSRGRRPLLLQVGVPVPEIIDLPTRPRRSRSLFLLIGGLAVLLLGSGRLLAFYVDALWFNSLGYMEVFRKTLLLQWSLFGVFFALTFVLLFGSFLLLRDTSFGKAGLIRSVLVNGQPVTLDVGRWL